MRPEERKAVAAARLQTEARLTAEVLGARGSTLVLASNFEPDMIPQITEDDRKRFLAWLDANAAEVATWPKWKRDAYTLIKDPIDG